jgi:hypothetical protein
MFAEVFTGLEVPISDPFPGVLRAIFRFEISPNARRLPVVVVAAWRLLAGVFVNRDAAAFSSVRCEAELDSMVGDSLGVSVLPVLSDSKDYLYLINRLGCFVDFPVIVCMDRQRRRREGV